MDYGKLIFQNPEYNFLREDVNLGSNVIYLTLGGSHAYGTNNEHSDIDVRGICTERPEVILGLSNFDQREDSTTDTVVYSLRKIASLLMNCNPNCIELLGTKPEHIIFMSYAGKQLRENSDLFLTQKAYKTFGGYALSQLKRLENALIKDMPKEQVNRQIVKTLTQLIDTFNERYTTIDSTNLWVTLDTDYNLLLNANIKDYPLMDFKNIYSEMNNIVTNWDKSRRNNKKTEEGIWKHAMHLIRLLIKGAEILEGKPLQTYCGHHIPFLMKIRNGEYTKEEFFELVNFYDEKFKYAYENTSLPEKPDFNKVNELIIDINKRVVLGK